MAKLLKPREEVEKTIAARIRAGNDLTAKADVAERTAGYRDWLSLFATWRDETIAVLDTLYEEKDTGREFGYVTETSERSSPMHTFPHRKRALESGLFRLDNLIGRLELAVGDSPDAIALLTISKPSHSGMIGDKHELQEAKMAEGRPEEKPMPTIWHVPDELWERIEPVLSEHDPPKSTGRPRIDQREALDAVIFRMRSGCQWNRLPREFPDDSSVHRTFQRWLELGVLDLVWERLIEECEELGGVDFEWQAADGSMGKARFGGIS